MLGLRTESVAVPATWIRAQLADALADFHMCRYRRLADRLPRLICHGHILAADGAESDHTLLAEMYLLATRMLVKLDDQQLGWMAADRARTLADVGGNAFTAAEAARNLAVLARKAAWHSEAMAIALAAADHPALRDGTPAAERRARYYTDLAAAFGHWGRRDDCFRALLAAECHAPEEVHARPAVRALVYGLLLSGRTTPELRGLAARCGIR